MPDQRSSSASQIAGGKSCLHEQVKKCMFSSYAFLHRQHLRDPLRIRALCFSPYFKMSASSVHVEMRNQTTTPLARVQTTLEGFNQAPVHVLLLRVPRQMVASHCWLDIAWQLSLVCVGWSPYETNNTRDLFHLLLLCAEASPTQKSLRTKSTLRRCDSLKKNRGRSRHLSPSHTRSSKKQQQPPPLLLRVEMAEEVEMVEGRNV